MGLNSLMALQSTEKWRCNWRSAAFLNGKAAHCAIVSGYTYREPTLTCDSCSVTLM
jgi:hypothetical protein